MYSDETMAMAAGVSAIQLVVSLVLLVILIVATWKIFEKAGVPGWAALVPFYSHYKMAQIAFGNGWIFLLGLIPCVGFIYSIVFCVKLAQAFGKGGAFAVGLIFLNPIFLMILGFGSAQYIDQN